MSQLKSICIISGGYPYKEEHEFTFVARLVEQFADFGIKCVVIVPQSLTKLVIRRRLKRPLLRSYKTIKGNEVRVYQPYVITFGNRPSINQLFNKNVYKKILANLCFIPDVIYGHFWHSAYNVFDYAQEREIPLFVATGESVIDFWNKVSLSHPVEKFTNYISGVIAVSTKNKNESSKLGLLRDESKCVVIPNAVNSQLFLRKNKAECRKLLGFPDHDFIVVFVGWFIERKGPLRLLKAIEMLNDSNIKVVFIGKGPQEPFGDNILYKGPVNTAQLSSYLNAADVFALPTQNEGCCNAIIEAMACGLPIISSDLPFNYDILNQNNSILIDPNSTKEISEAIRLLVSDSDFRKKLSEEAYRMGQSLTIEKRAEKIISFMNNQIKNDNI